MVEEELPAPYDNVQASASSNDLQEYLKRSTGENGENGAAQPPPTPGSLGSLTRADSIFSFSKASFSSQLSGLTSMTLPQAESLAANVRALPTAPKAVKALTTSATEIQRWTHKAISVLSNLDAEDDVEWAAAAGRSSLDDVDSAVNKFERLIEVYVQAIEELQARPDIDDIDSNDLTAVVEQMEQALMDWDKVRQLLKGVHEQVELAMEWEELWGVVLGDVANELESLDQLVFEMEEKRHTTMRADAENKAGAGIDIDELETIVEDSPTTTNSPARNRMSMLPTFTAPSVAAPAHNPADDQKLLALFARMQPLRASLDFLPMRLSMFQSRANKLFPSACQELDEKRDRLEQSWRQLEKEADNLRRELGEDRWVLVFRNAGRQAQKMIESVERTCAKLQEAMDSGAQHSNPAALAKKVESFEAKRMHYGPAIDRVLAIIQKGVKDRLTVNGEILRLHLDLTARAASLHEQMDIMEGGLEEIHANRDAQLRDSISTVISMDRSVSGSMTDTPGSSPASSVIFPAGKLDGSFSSLNGSKIRASSRSRPTTTHRFSSLPQPRRASSSLLSSPSTRLASPSPSGAPRSSITPTPVRRPGPTPTSNKPRWNSSTNTNDLVVGHNFKPLSPTKPSPYQIRAPSRSQSRASSIPLRSPLSRETSDVSTPATNGRPSHLAHHSTSSFAQRIASPSPVRSSLLDPVPYSKVSRNSTTPLASTTNMIRGPNSRTQSQSNISTPSTTRPSPMTLPSSARSRHSTIGLPQHHPQPHFSRRAGAETPMIPEDSSDTEPAASDIPSSPPLPPQPSTSRTSKTASSPVSAAAGSSPLASKHQPQPQSQRPGSRLGKRLSMLPLPSSILHRDQQQQQQQPGHTRTASGRNSSLGNRPAWR